MAATASWITAHARPRKKRRRGVPDVVELDGTPSHHPATKNINPKPVRTKKERPLVQHSCVPVPARPSPLQHRATLAGPA
jgi:hypothetical protein